MMKTQNYKNLVVAGYGAMGSAFFVLAKEFMAGFQNVIIIDKKNVDSLPDECHIFKHLDIEDTQELLDILEQYQGDFMFINLTSFVDSFRVREVISELNGAYIDTSCSMIFNSLEAGCSILLPYTYQRTANSQPHFLCCGANPGMVEIIARKIMVEEFPNESDFDVFFFEHDQFASSVKHVDKIPFSWSPESVIDEVMLSPSFELKNGKPLEADSAPAAHIKMMWNKKVIPARLVGHEEVWNLQSVQEGKVHNSLFAYAFTPEIMSELTKDPDWVSQRAYVPDSSIEVEGNDSLAVKVVARNTGQSKIAVWSVEHSWAQRQHSINSVQFQVVSSLLFFCELLLQTPRRPSDNTYCASTVPLNAFPPKIIDKLLFKYNINWNYTNDEISLERITI